jgi:UDP-N-acetylmuramoyl-tripeptide--D-alanyl-D-alanine ligase
MRPRSLDAVAAAVGGSVAPAGDSTTVRRVVTDSRGDLEGALFAALPGERTDGHDHVAEALARGAAAALVSRDTSGSGPLIRVGDVGEALMALARDERYAFAGPVVGITGSSGKTCTKDFAAAALTPRFRVHASPRSFNTEVGVPLTILDAAADTEALVLEMGSRGLGHIALLCRTARPTVSVVTNVGSAHLGMFGTRRNIADAKAEIVEALEPDGVAILNADDPVVAAFRDRTAARVVTFGVGAAADVRAEEVHLDDDARAAFTLRWRDESETVGLSVPGEHMVSNALAAAACGLVLGVSAAECAAALKGATVSGWRMEVHDRPDGVRVVNDAYNANPASAAAALKAARWMARDRRCIAVLGEMAELGEASAEEHDRLGELVARLGIEELVTVGEPGRVIARAAVREGMEAAHVRECATADDAGAQVRALVRPGDVVLVKASRAVGLERLALALAGEEAA